MYMTNNTFINKYKPYYINDFCLDDTLLYTLNYPLHYIVMIMPVNYICSLLLYLLINKLL